jgi:dihydropyrimidinase
MNSLFNIPIIKKMTKNVAKVHNLFPQKGIIKVGSDADLFIMDREVALLNKNHSKCDYNLYENLQSYGEILSTLSRGKFVIKDNKFIGGKGKYIK